MNIRLSIDERGELAFKLRIAVLSKENPERLEAISDPKFQPHDIALGIYAFEFFLDKFRDRFRLGGGEGVSYNIGWSHESLLEDEERISKDRVCRMSATLFIGTLLERGTIDLVAKEWKERAFHDQAFVDEQQLMLFFHEVFYELAYEYSYLLYDTFHPPKK